MRVLRGMIAMTAFAALALLILQPAGAQQQPPRRDELQNGAAPQEGRPRNFERFAERFDANKDGRITREEFTGQPQMFERMDRNGDGVITAADFAGQPASGPQSFPPGDPATVFRLLDADSDGKVTKEEQEKFFSRIDANRDGQISEDEWRQAMQSRGGGMSRMQEFPTARPAPGQAAPEFDLRDLKGARVSLAGLLKTKPVVIEFGSFT